MYESGMTFADFGVDNFYHIEKSNFYKETLKKGFKIVEFVTYYPSSESNGGNLIFVEAKTTLRKESEKDRFYQEMSDISQKFLDSLKIICGIWHGGRKNKPRLPKNVDKFRVDGGKIIFLLVVKELESRKMQYIRDEIYKQFPLEERLLWEFEVMVYNEEMAQKKNFVLAESKQ